MICMHTYYQFYLPVCNTSNIYAIYKKSAHVLNDMTQLKTLNFYKLNETLNL